MALVPDTQLVLGDVTFAAYEVPERIPFGGEQRLVVQKYIGGGRVVEALGPDDKELCWSGRFQSPNAGPRARHLDYLRRQGAAQTLSWDQFSYTVVIRAFEADYERAYQIPYRIACLVVADNTQPIAASPSAPVDELVSADAAALSSLASASGNAAIASGVGSLQSLLASVGALAQAAAASLAQILSQLASLDALIAGAIAAAGSASAGGLAAFGGTAGAAAAAVALLSGERSRRARHPRRDAGAWAPHRLQCRAGLACRLCAHDHGRRRQSLPDRGRGARRRDAVEPHRRLERPRRSGAERGMQLRLPPLDPGAGGGLSG